MPTVSLLYEIGALIIAWSLVLVGYFRYNLRKRSILTSLILGIVLFILFYTLYEYLIRTVAPLPIAILWSTYPMGVFKFLYSLGVSLVVLALGLYVGNMAYKKRAVTQT